MSVTLRDRTAERSDRSTSAAADCSSFTTLSVVVVSKQVLQCRRRAGELRSSVIRPLRSSSTVTSGRVTDNRHHNSAETNYKAFVTTLLLTGTLVVFWLPFMIFQLLSAHINPKQSVHFLR